MEVAGGGAGGQEERHEEEDDFWKSGRTEGHQAVIVVGRGRVIGEPEG